jgi:hypothetical protein
MTVPANRIAVAAGLLALLGVAGVFAARHRKDSDQQAALAQALLEVRGEMCSGRNLKGTGVRMEVFASADLTRKPLQMGLVPVLDLNVTPSAAVVPGQTVRWSGWVKAPASGRHRFILPTGVRGQLTISRMVILDPASTLDTVSTDLEEARLYPFTLVVTVDRGATDAGTWLLSWAQPSRQAQPVTRGYLFPPTDAVAKPPDHGVTRASS